MKISIVFFIALLVTFFVVDSESSASTEEHSDHDEFFCTTTEADAGSCVEGDLIMVDGAIGMMKYCSYLDLIGSETFERDHVLICSYKGSLRELRQSQPQAKDLSR